MKATIYCVYYKLLVFNPVASNICTTISLIKQGQASPVKQLLSTSTARTGVIALMYASIEAMNLDILRYLLDTFKPNPKIADFLG